LFYEHVHNDYLELLVERGLLGLGLWLLAVLTPLVLAVRVLGRHQDSLHRGLALASIAAGSALLLHSLVDFNLQIPANRWWFHALILLGALASQVPRRLRRALQVVADTGSGSGANGIVSDGKPAGQVTIVAAAAL